MRNNQIVFILVGVFFLTALAAAYLVPGNPAIIIQHMPGAGSLKATAYLASIAPKDGSVIGTSFAGRAR